MSPISLEAFARAVDHTLLDPGATAADVDRLCDEAAEHRFAGVCVYPCWVERAAARLAGRAAAATVISFPHGADRTAAKATAVRDALAAGADEVDVVTAYGLVAAGAVDAARADAEAVVEAAHGERADAVVKLIVEAPRLDAQALRAACGIVAASGADFAKTGTGTAGPATVGTVRALRAALPGRVAVKASGGIRTAAGAAELLGAGASRLGTSAALAILEELEARAVA